ncbi:MAG: urease accessory UreF family protein [Kofleriaceae bacterium]
MTSWIVLQLADSAFPTGGFAHSGGLEALLHARAIGPVDELFHDLVLQTAHGAAPIAGAAWDAPDRLSELDRFTRATTWSHVAARASRAQGKSLLDTATRAFELPALQAARALPLDGHLAPMWGFVMRTLDVTRDDALAGLLHVTLRGQLSAAIRLGAIGPTEAQAIHHRLHPVLDRALALARTLGLADVAQTAPVVELVQATHDRLYSRLFQS